MNIHKNK